MTAIHSSKGFMHHFQCLSNAIQWTSGSFEPFVLNMEQILKNVSYCHLQTIQQHGIRQPFWSKVPQLAIKDSFFLTEPVYFVVHLCLRAARSAAANLVRLYNLPLKIITDRSCAGRAQNTGRTSMDRWGKTIDIPAALPWKERLLFSSWHFNRRSFLFLPSPSDITSKGPGCTVSC